MTLKWSKERPTQPGWYWIGMVTDEGIITLIGHVRNEEGSLVAQIYDGAFNSVHAEIFHFWAGPIPVPEGELVHELKGHLTH